MPIVYLSFEGVVLLTEVFLPVMIRVSSSVSPLKGLVCRHVDVLEVVVSGVAAVRAWSGDGQGARGAVREGQGEGRCGPHK